MSDACVWCGWRTPMTGRNYCSPCAFSGRGDAPLGSGNLPPSSPPKEQGGREIVGERHYAVLDPEPIDVIEAWGLEEDGHLMQAFQYIARARNKGQYTSDCLKAAWYCCRAAGFKLNFQSGTITPLKGIDDNG